MNKDNSYKGRSHFEKTIDTKTNTTLAGSAAAQKTGQTKTKIAGKKKEN